MEVFILLGLIILNGLFVMSEIALVSARKPRLESAAEKGDKRARAALDLSLNPEIFLSAAQIGITVIAILTGVYAEARFGERVQPWVERVEVLRPYAKGLSTTMVVIVVTFLTIVIGELIPKRLGLQRAEAIAKGAAKPMRIFATITHPFVWLLNKTSNGVFKLFKIRTVSDDTVTEEEIKAIITEGTEAGTIEEEEREMIERIFHLGDRNITSLMTHRSDIAWFDVTNVELKVRDVIIDQAHSIYPVCEGDIDNMKGIVSIKDLYVADDLTDLANLRALMKPALFVPNNNSAYQVMEKLRLTKNYAAFIVDEYGSVLGMITLSDIMEAIIGDLPESGDEEDYEVIPREDGTFLVDAQINFYDFLSYFDKTDYLDDEFTFDTLAGCILH
ncbi:MAG: HlyC/CorC family transporter, partial [Sphingobacteriales bacterium]